MNAWPLSALPIGVSVGLHAPIYLLTHPLIHSPTHSLTYSFIHSLTHSLTHSPTRPLTHLLIHSLTHSLTHSLAGRLLAEHFVELKVVFLLSQSNRDGAAAPTWTVVHPPGLGSRLGPRFEPAESGFECAFLRAAEVVVRFHVVIEFCVLFFRFVQQSTGVSFEASGFIFQVLNHFVLSLSAFGRRLVVHVCATQALFCVDVKCLDHQSLEAVIWCQLVDTLEYLIREAVRMRRASLCKRISIRLGNTVLCKCVM